MSAGTNSRGNANEILGQCQYLSNYTPTPPLTTNSQLMTSQVNVGLEEGYLCNCSDTGIAWSKLLLAFPLELVPANILNNGCFSCFSNILVSSWAKNLSKNAIFGNLFVLHCNTWAHRFAHSSIACWQKSWLPRKLRRASIAKHDASK